MEKITVAEDTFLYEGREYFFDMEAFTNMDEFDKYLEQKESEGYTKCFFHKAFNTKDGAPVMLNGVQMYLIMFKLFK
jgi:hypothetical protein